MNSKRDIYYQNTPLCKFGPGGEYVNNWNIGDQVPVTSKSSNSIGKLLDIIAEIAGLTEYTKQESDNYGIVNDWEKNGKTSGSIAKAISCPIVNIQFSNQKTLFGDNSAGGKIFAGQQNNNIRTYRRSSGKRINRKVHRQIPLFETHQKGCFIH